MSSRRLPGKVLRKIQGYPYTLIELIYMRLKRVSGIAEIVLATSTDSSDDILVDEANKLGLKVVRGDLDNVLSRFVKVVGEYSCDHVIRITADCPLVSPELIEMLIDIHLENNNDYTSTALNPTYPDGLDAEIIKADILIDLYKKDLTTVDKEHVTYFVYSNPKDYQLGSLTSDNNLSHIRLTVDENIDLKFMNIFIKDIAIDPVKITYDEIEKFISYQSEEYFINSDISRNEGLEVALLKE